MAIMRCHNEKIPISFVLDMLKMFLVKDVSHSEHFC